MDKYEYQLKTEHIRQVAARKEYGEAAKLCDTIDWTKIRDVKMLTLAADVYTAVGEYEKAIDILQQAYEYAAMGRRIVYRLTELALKADSYDDAKNYFEEFCRMAPNDQGRYILLYKMARYQKATLDEKIKILEAYKREDFDEKVPDNKYLHLLYIDKGNQISIEVVFVQQHHNQSQSMLILLFE